MESERLRRWGINWLLFMSVLHLLVGLLMTYGAALPLFNAYHQTVLQAFGLPLNQTDALHLQQWWVNLFGATLQFVGVLLFVLVMIGKNFRSAKLWLALIIALLVWASQDIFISSQIHLQTHYWVDGVTLALLVPALAILCFIDREKESVDGRTTNL